MAQIRARVLVSGRVQGVFFRDSTRRAARAAGVRGWVRNLWSGAVEALLEGEEKSVEDVVQFMRTGPEFANVEDVEVEYGEYQGEFNAFDIRLDA